MTNYILGSGLAASIAKIYNPEFLMIGPELKKNMQFGPHYVYKNEDTEDFLDRLFNFRYLFKFDTKTILIGYYFDKDFYCIPTPEIITAYKEKTRGKDFKDDDSIMTNKTHKFDVYDINFNYLMMKMLQTPAIQGEIVKVDLLRKKIYLKVGEVLSYDKLISTIPAPSFMAILGLSCEEYKARDIYFSRLLKDNVEDVYDFTFDFIYYADPELDYYRITCNFDKYQNIEYYDVESLDSLSTLGYSSQIRKVEYRRKIYQGQKLDLTDSRFDDIFFIGRYSRWDNSIRMTEMIQDAKKVSEILNG